MAGGHAAAHAAEMANLGAEAFNREQHKSRGSDNHAASMPAAGAGSHHSPGALEHLLQNATESIGDKAFQGNPGLQTFGDKIGVPLAQNEGEGFLADSSFDAYVGNQSPFTLPKEAAPGLHTVNNLGDAKLESAVSPDVNLNVKNVGVDMTNSHGGGGGH